MAAARNDSDLCMEAAPLPADVYRPFSQGMFSEDLVVWIREPALLIRPVRVGLIYGSPVYGSGCASEYPSKANPGASKTTEIAQDDVLERLMYYICVQHVPAFTFVVRDEIARVVLEISHQ